MAERHYKICQFKILNGNIIYQIKHINYCQVFIDFGVSELLFKILMFLLLKILKMNVKKQKLWSTEFDTFDEMSDDEEYYSDKETDIDEFEISFECDKFVGIAKLKYEFEG